MRGSASSLPFLPPKTCTWEVCTNPIDVTIDDGLEGATLRLCHIHYFFYVRLVIGLSQREKAPYQVLAIGGTTLPVHRRDVRHLVNALSDAEPCVNDWTRLFGMRGESFRVVRNPRCPGFFSYYETFDGTTLLGGLGLSIQHISRQTGRLFFSAVHETPELVHLRREMLGHPQNYRLVKTPVESLGDFSGSVEKSPG